MKVLGGTRLNEGMLVASEASVEKQVEQTFNDLSNTISQRTDRCFSVLMVVQWLVSIGIAIWVTPRTWIGSVSLIDPYVPIAIFFGGFVSLGPLLLAWQRPGHRYTRHAIAGGQMLMSTLLIHLAGGRTEVHFHIFGSLAFLAFYLDWTVLLTASAVILVDHGLGNFFWPSAVFGPGGYQPWRWIEHVGWVVFCDIFLIASCIGRVRSLRALAARSVQQAILLQQAYTDALTGMPNRLRFQKDMEIALAKAQATGIGFALMYLDLDRFKEINDLHGHALGDQVLTGITRRLRQESTGDIQFARLGGDEFVAICPRHGGDHGELSEQASHVLRHLLLPINVNGLTFSVGASMGLSLYPEDGVDEDRLLIHADKAMYSVKRKGRRGFAFYERSMDASAEDRSAATDRLRQAIEGKEFVLHYQPLLSCSGQVDGLEALVRWVSPDGSIVMPPGDFIPLAEETGLIIELGALVLNQVCAQVAAWSANGIPFKQIAINLSPRQLEQGTFPTLLDQAMAIHGIRAEWIAFEITESAYLPNDTILEAGLEALRVRGIKVSLDDFGTGYSSLGRLQTMAFNTLKIDQVFVRGLGRYESAPGMVKAIINMAHGLGMSVVGEGVETAAQADILRTLGCDHLQGYYLSKPLPAERAKEFILQHHTRAAASVKRFPEERSPAEIVIMQQETASRVKSLTGPIGVS